MPQLDVIAYFVQYIWMLMGLLLLYVWMGLRILPSVQEHLGLRVQILKTSEIVILWNVFWSI